MRRGTHSVEIPEYDRSTGDVSRASVQLQKFASRVVIPFVPGVSDPDAEYAGMRGTMLLEFRRVVGFVPSQLRYDSEVQSLEVVPGWWGRLLVWLRLRERQFEYTKSFYATCYAAQHGNLDIEAEV